MHRSHIAQSRRQLRWGAEADKHPRGSSGFKLELVAGHGAGRELRRLGARAAQLAVVPPGSRKLKAGRRKKLKTGSR